MSSLSLWPWSISRIIGQYLMMKRMLSLFFILVSLPNSMSQYVNDSSGINNFRSYYSCYFNKYFNLDPDAEDASRDAFVSGLLENALAAVEVSPTPSCVEWICDENLIWQKLVKESLEVWAYYAQEGSTVESWQRCLEDEKEEFARKNYSQHAVGVYAIVSIGDGGERLFYVPSTECHDKGEDLVESLVKIIVDTRDTDDKKEDLLLDVYENSCNPVVTPAYTEPVSGYDTMISDDETDEYLDLDHDGIRITPESVSVESGTMTHYYKTSSMATSSIKTSTVLIPKLTTSMREKLPARTSANQTSTSSLTSAKDLILSSYLIGSSPLPLSTSPPSPSQMNILISSDKSNISHLHIITAISLSLSLICFCCCLANTNKGRRIKKRVLRFLFFCLLDKLGKEAVHALQVVITISNLYHYFILTFIPELICGCLRW